MKRLIHFSKIFQIYPF